MAEFCFECFNKMCGGIYRKKYFIYAKELDACEECGKYKLLIARFKRTPWVWLAVRGK